MRKARPSYPTGLGKSLAERPTVCLILEGSYPYVTGGVSAWVHQLIRYLDDINFVLYTISPAKDQPLRYELPANVVAFCQSARGRQSFGGANYCFGCQRKRQPRAAKGGAQ